MPRHSAAGIRHQNRRRPAIPQALRKTFAKLAPSCYHRPLIMRVLAVVPSLYDTAPGQRFRIEQWEPILRESSIEITYAPFETDELRGVLHRGGNVLRKIGAVTRNLKRRRGEFGDLGRY